MRELAEQALRQLPVSARLDRGGAEQVAVRRGRTTPSDGASGPNAKGT